MSGTSLDAIDAAWVEFGVSGKPKILDFETTPISNQLKEARKQQCLNTCANHS